MTVRRKEPPGHTVREPSEKSAAAGGDAMEVRASFLASVVAGTLAALASLAGLLVEDGDGGGRRHRGELCLWPGRSCVNGGGDEPPRPAGPFTMCQEQVGRERADDGQRQRERYTAWRGE